MLPHRDTDDHGEADVPSVRLVPDPDNGHSYDVLGEMGVKGAGVG